TYEFDVSDGAKQFPWASFDGQPRTDVQISFPDPDRVRDVTIWHGTESYAGTSAKLDRTLASSIYVDYYTVPQERSLSDPALGLPQSEDEFRLQLPEHMRDFELKDVTPSES